jgi:3-oxoacyl-[acyl-carrier protein] reductase
VGPIQALVNNAGIARDGVLATMRPVDIDAVLDVNLRGTLHLTRLVARPMLTRGTGSILNISSIIGLRGYSGLAVYSATKGGLDAMTRALARELGPRNIRVNSIAPGYLETEMSSTLGAEQRDQIVRRTPLCRLGRPDDVVGAVLFLLSPASAFITGQTFVIDGGVTC